MMTLKEHTKLPYMSAYCYFKHHPWNSFYQYQTGQNPLYFSIIFKLFQNFLETIIIEI